MSSMPHRGSYHAYGKRGPPHSGPSHRGHHNMLPHQNPPMGGRMLPPQPPQPMESHAPPPPSGPADTPPTSNTSNQEQILRFVREGWSKAKRDLNDSDAQISYYAETEPSPALKNFVPFDLEAFAKSRRTGTPPSNSS